MAEHAAVMARLKEEHDSVVAGLKEEYEAEFKLKYNVKN